MTKNEKKLLQKIGRKNGLKARAALEKVYGKDPYKTINKLSVISRRRKAQKLSTPKE